MEENEELRGAASMDELLEQVRHFEDEAEAAIAEDRGLKSLAARQADLAGRLRVLAQRLERELAASDDSGRLADLHDLAERLEAESKAALDEAQSLHDLAHRQASLAAELRLLALRRQR
jgi:hypothetical protein